VSAGTAFNHIQRNVVREWLSRPVRRDHRVYRAAARCLSDAEAAAAASDPPRRRTTAIPPRLGTGWERLRRGFQSAVERRRRPPTRRKKKCSHGRRTSLDNNNNNNNSHDIVYGAVIMTKVYATVHPVQVYLMNVD